MTGWYVAVAVACIATAAMADRRALHDRIADQTHELDYLRAAHRARLRRRVESAVRAWHDGVPGEWRGDISVSGESRLTARQPGPNGAFSALPAAGLEPWARADRTPLVGADAVIWDDDPDPDHLIRIDLAELAPTETPR